jgi:hypothetical protein
VIPKSVNQAQECFLGCLLFSVLHRPRQPFSKGIQTLDGAKERVREIGRLWPGKYVIENEETGERVFVSTSEERKN